MLLKYTFTDLLNLLPWRKLKRKKAKAREIIAQRRRIMQKETCKQLSTEIVTHIEALEEFRQAKRVMLYFPIHNEADLIELCSRYKDEKEFFLPVTHRSSIEVRRYTHGDRLHRGSLGIPEPTGKRFRGELDLIIVPGLVFDIYGNRLGRGGGYYDRFLRHFKHTTQVGVGYDFQLVNKTLPTGFFDRKVNIVVTDKRTIKID
ncbi:MAG: 5-formyltetrahydrofolate cyclo-ligase [Paludibacteraceae bacterium]|nr:5-formyltetrahydrofolate cyclo-ligase [Paludibacteraceae bacterium]